MYSLLAGFVEAGETLEQAVAREVFEESGVQIKNIRYFGSQAWPFPSNLMLGFTAEWASGDLYCKKKKSWMLSFLGMMLYPNSASR
jgi:NAD+ diphosphatase